MKTKSPHKSRAKLVGLWIKLVMFALVVADVTVNFVHTNSSLAQSSAGIPLEEQISQIFSISTSLPALIGILATIVIIVAGVVYAFDLGGGKQSGLAKEMIISAISGVILFILARWLLTEINSLFINSGTPPVASPVSPPPEAPPHPDIWSPL